MDEVLALLALDLSLDVEVAAYIHAVLAALATLAWTVTRASAPFVVRAYLSPRASLASRVDRDVPAPVRGAWRGRAPPSRV